MIFVDGLMNFNYLFCEVKNNTEFILLVHYELKLIKNLKRILSLVAKLQFFVFLCTFLTYGLSDRTEAISSLCIYNSERGLSTTVHNHYVNTLWTSINKHKAS